MRRCYVNIQLAIEGPDDADEDRMREFVSTMQHLFENVRNPMHDDGFRLLDWWTHDIGFVEQDTLPPRPTPYQIAQAALDQAARK